MSGVEMSLSNSALGDPVKFKVIVQESTSNCLILESFYNRHIAGKTIDRRTYPKSSLADVGISRVAFSTSLGSLHHEDPLHDRSAPQFVAKGLSKVPVCHQGYKFTPACFVVDHIFQPHEFESKFVMVLGLDFLKDAFIRVQWSKSGFILELPPSPATMDKLIIYTDGCCLSNGQSAPNTARAGYGIYFPQLPRD